MNRNDVFMRVFFLLPSKKTAVFFNVGGERKKSRFAKCSFNSQFARFFSACFLSVPGEQQNPRGGIEDLYLAKRQCWCYAFSFFLPRLMHYFLWDKSDPFLTVEGAISWGISRFTLDLAFRISKRAVEYERFVFRLFLRLSYAVVPTPSVRGP